MISLAHLRNCSRELGKLMSTLLQLNPIQTYLKTFLFACVLLLGFQGCPLYKPKLDTGKCQVNEECSSGFACRNNRCEDIYYPKSEIRQF